MQVVAQFQGNLLTLIVVAQECFSNAFFSEYCKLQNKTHHFLKITWKSKQILKCKIFGCWECNQLIHKRTNQTAQCSKLNKNRKVVPTTIQIKRVFTKKRLKTLFQWFSSGTLDEATINQISRTISQRELKLKSKMQKVLL